MQLTRRMTITLAAYWANPDIRQEELAARFGVGQSAIAMRIARARRRFTVQGIVLPPRRNKMRGRNIRLAQLSACGTLQAAA